MEIDRTLLAREAVLAKEHAYVPYSHFRVGAALLTAGGVIYRGCNIENAAYSPTNCAERTAIFKAVSEGERSFTAIAIAGDTHDYLYPCGVCRQVLMEFCDPKTFEIILVKSDQELRSFTLEALYPGGFSAEELRKI